MTVCSLNSQISPTSKNRRPIHHENTKSLRPGQSLISSPRHGCSNNVLFCGKMFWKFLALGNLTCPLEPWWLCVTQRMRTWTRDLGNQYCMTKQGSSYPQIVYWLPVSSVWSYPIGWAHIKINVRSHHATRSHRGAWAHVRLPRTKLKLMAINWAQVTQKK